MIWDLIISVPDHCLSFYLARLDYGGVIAGFPKSVSGAEFCKRLKYLPEKIPFRDGYIYNNNYMVTMAGHVAETLGQDT